MSETKKDWDVNKNGIKLALRCIICKFSLEQPDQNIDAALVLKVENVPNASPEPPKDWNWQQVCSSLKYITSK